MVSTRSVKYKFSEGEKVLCYEPDPAKTKVLYNSKVLDISCRKDETGRKVVHFLIHFQGWNSTWDRFVTEDYVLKDTEENRQLQKHLAKRAQLIARLGCCRGGNLYKRERKKRVRKLTERGAGDAGVEEGAPPGGGGGCTTPASTRSDSEASDTHEDPLPLSITIRRTLELDHLLVSQQNKVLNLPAEPNAVAILEMFLKEYATSQMKQACNKKASLRNQSTLNPNTSLDTFCRNMNLCREVVDGLRVYLDFMLEKVLLYKEERGQHYQAVTVGLTREPIRIKEEVEDVPRKATNSAHGSHIKEESMDCDDVMVIEVDRRRSLRSHTHQPGGETSLQNGKSVSRQLSTDASTSKMEPCGVKWDPGFRGMSSREQEMLSRIHSWHLVPDRVRAAQPNLPCLIYGATHLARLFIKLPELLQQSNHSEAKTNLLIEYLANFMKFLDDHPEWFGEQHYRDNVYPPPPSDTPTSLPAE